MWETIIIFTICQFINVALNTIKTIIMHKEEKISSSIINAITYGFYAVIVVMTATALPLWQTVVITIITNLIGVYMSMWLLEKFKKDSLWEIVATVKEEDTFYLADEKEFLSDYSVKGQFYKNTAYLFRDMPFLLCFIFYCFFLSFFKFKRCFI